MNEKNEIDINEVVSGIFFVETTEQQKKGLINSVLKAVKTLLKRKVV